MDARPGDNSVAAETPEPPSALARRLVEMSLEGATETDLFRTFCERLRALGVPIDRATIGLDTLHPILLGQRLIWTPKEELFQETYDRAYVEQSEQVWAESPFHYLESRGERKLRQRLDEENPQPAFSVYDDLRAEGLRDYLVLLRSLDKDNRFGEIDCVYSSWASRAAEGFSDAHIAVIEEVFPAFGLALKQHITADIAQTLVETYLGRDAGRRVLGGRIERGVSESIRAVLWLSDLQGSTKIVDTLPPDELMVFINDYAECIVESVQEQEGQVLKFMGDGILAFFPVGEGSAEELAAACARAVDASDAAFRRVEELNQRRQASALPTTQCVVALHFGEMLYGNIGSRDRLDFTVIGPSVNELSRMESLARNLDQRIILSTAFADVARGERQPRVGPALVSLGRYALRGVQVPQELYTLER